MGQYDAASGFQVECNENGELVNLYTTSDNGGVLRIKDGEIVEWEDPDSGISVKQAEDGSVTASVTTEEGTYSADDSGNVWLNGKQIKKDGELIVDGGSSGSSKHSPSKPRPSGGTSDGELDSYTITASSFYYDNFKQYNKNFYNWDGYIYLSFYKAGEIQVTRQQDGTYAFTLPGYEYNTGSATSSDRVSMPELRFVGTGFDEERTDLEPGNYQAKFTLQQDDIMKLTLFHHEVYSDGSERDSHKNIYLKKYELKLWFGSKTLSEDGTVELLSGGTIVEGAPYSSDLPVSEKDFNESFASYIQGGFNTTGLKSLRSGHSGDKQGGITQSAEKDAGEDGGVAIPAAIAIGLLGTGAAVAAGAAASGAVAAGAGGASGAAAGTDGGRSGEDERKKKRYKMYIQKDFGDAIRKGADPVTVRTRIAEVSENGTERDRNDLTAQINSVSGGGMEIHSAVLAGRYCEAVISIPEDYEGETADITFLFEGEGGSFNNTVRFRAVGEPQIVFLTDDASRLSYNGQFISVDMIEGDGLTYPLRFTVKDALTEPDISDMYGRDNDGFFAEFEKTDEPYTYIAHIANNTATKSENGFFLHSEEIITAIYVKCGGKEPACGSVRVTLVPEGLSIACREIKDGFMTVDTNRDESAAELDPVIRPVGFETVLAYTVDEENGRRAYIVEPHDYEVSFGELCGEKECIETFKTLLKYEIDTRMADDIKFAFRPKVVLPQPKDPFEIEIPISATHNGNYFAVKLSIKLYGEQPKIPTE